MDTFYPLSNICLTKDIVINDFTNVNSDVDTKNDDKITLKHRVFNAITVAGTDINNTVGFDHNIGLENYSHFN